MTDAPNLFRHFVSEMEVLLRENEQVNGKSQRHLLNRLFAIEKEFKAIMLSTPHGTNVYEDFMIFILDDKENKLSIRPYFRERQDTFSNYVFPILKAKESKRLHRFKINFLFAKWALKIYTGPNRKALDLLFDEMLEVRRLLCENNLPLAINRAKLFWSNATAHHLEYMDLIQDSSRGLLEAIDKFVPPYKTVFRSVAIGRMTLNMTDDNSSTLVKLPPKDKRILYRARKARKKSEDISGKEVQAFVNESFQDTTAAEIDLIEAATSHVTSIDEQIDGQHSMADTMADPDSLADQVENSELQGKLLILMEKLKTLEIKVLLMKNGEIYGILS
jgi:DNA-directed RNA polymerase specialized sigma subunit